MVFYPELLKSVVWHADDMDVDRAGPVPPYRQIAAILRERITSGELAPGDRLPSVTELMASYSVARTTAVKAVKVLTDEGLAESVQGWGAFVAKR
jgi:GntR family transcriptional regulator